MGPDVTEEQERTHTNTQMTSYCKSLSLQVKNQQPFTDETMLVIEASIGSHLKKQYYIPILFGGTCSRT